MPFSVCIDLFVVGPRPQVATLCFKPILHLLPHMEVGKQSSPSVLGESTFLCPSSCSSPNSHTHICPSWCLAKGKKRASHHNLFSFCDGLFVPLLDVPSSEAALIRTLNLIPIFEDAHAQCTFRSKVHQSGLIWEYSRLNNNRVVFHVLHPHLIFGR